MNNLVNLGANQFTSNKALPIPTGGSTNFFFSLDATIYDPISDVHTRYFGTLNYNFTDFGTNHLPCLRIASDTPTEIMIGPSVNSLFFYIVPDLRNADYTVSGSIRKYDNDEQTAEYTDTFSFGPNGIVGRNIEFVITINTDLPIFGNSLEFATHTQYSDFVGEPTLEKIENVYNWREGGEIIKPFKWFMENAYNLGTGTIEGFTPTGAVNTRIQNIYVDGLDVDGDTQPLDTDKTCLYYNASDNSAVLLTTGANINEVFYGDGNSYTSNGTSIYYDKFYYKWNNQIGQLYCASRFYTNIPMFATQNEAYEYINGERDINSAINFDDISQGIIPSNLTGLAELETTFSDTFHTSIFGVQYACSISALREIAGVLYSDDDSVIANIKKGLELYGENLLDSVIDLSYYPFSVTNVIRNTVPQNYINFGSYRTELSHNINRIVYNNGYIDCGSVDIKPTYKNFIDYDHTGLHIYLPYIGFKSLDTASYMGKRINVRYYIDFHTRGCTACLTANGLLLDTFEGMIGISQPINARDYSQYATQTINTLIRGSEKVFNPLGSATGGVIGGLGGAGGAIGAGVATGVNIDMALASTVYDISTNRAKRESKGVIGADTGGHLPQYVFFMFTYEEPVEPSNLKQVYGKPSNSGGSVASFNGFLKCSSIQLQCSRATAKERDEIKSLLASGVYI